MSLKRIAPLCRAWWVPAVALLAGCGTRMVPVAGKVVWADGSPATELAGGQIVFESPALKTSAHGNIERDGSFRLTTLNPNDGLLPGDYQALVIESRPSAEGSAPAPAAMDPKFSAYATSKMAMTVTPEQVPFPIVLTVERSAKKGGPAGPEKK